MTAAHLAILAGLVQAALVLGLYVWLGLARLRWVMATKGSIKMVALSKDAYPDRIKQVGNAQANQFELPVLFYAAIGLDLYFGADWLFAIAACAFVVTRYLHAFIHTTSNHVVRRFQAFNLGFFIVVAMWLWLFGRLLVTMSGAF